MFAKATLLPVVKGAVVPGTEIVAESLWSGETKCLVYVVRRPGCALCREEAQGIIQQYEAGAYPGVKLFGIIKEVAPVPGAATDDILGVDDFQTKYFGGKPLYLDTDMKFYEFLGRKSLLSQQLHSWNPFQLYTDFKLLGQRLQSKGVEGNLKGEGYLKGGILVLSPKDPKLVTYVHHERTGYELPFEDIKKAIDAVPIP